MVEEAAAIKEKEYKHMQEEVEAKSTCDMKIRPCPHWRRGARVQ